MLPQPPHGAALFLFCRGKHKRAASLDAICLAVAHGLERRSKSYYCVCGGSLMSFIFARNTSMRSSASALVRCAL